MLMAQGRHFCLLPRSVLIDQFLTFAISMTSVVNDSVGTVRSLNLIGRGVCLRDSQHVHAAV